MGSNLEAMFWTQFRVLYLLNGKSERKVAKDKKFAFPKMFKKCKRVVKFSLLDIG